MHNTSNYKQITQLAVWCFPSQIEQLKKLHVYQSYLRYANYQISKCSH
jgi:hypothetical protein